MEVFLYTLIGFTAGIVLALIIAFGLAAKFGFPNIFPGSGNPEAMAKSLVGMLVTSAQFLVGVFVIAVISLLIIGEKIEANVGMPVISAVIGYLLGRTYEGVKYYGVEKEK